MSNQAALVLLGSCASGSNAWKREEVSEKQQKEGGTAKRRIADIFGIFKIADPSRVENEMLRNLCFLVMTRRLFSLGRVCAHAVCPENEKWLVAMLTGKPEFRFGSHL
jgi:hypothetical protein